MTETEKAVLRIQSILRHLEAVNRQKLSEREQEVLTDVIASACDRVAYLLLQDSSVVFGSLAQLCRVYDTSHMVLSLDRCIWNEFPVVESPPRATLRTGMHTGAEEKGGKPPIFER